MNANIDKELFDLIMFGEYTLGLTRDEIERYIISRSGRKNVKRLCNKFNKIAGINTMGIHVCTHCGQMDTLMYHHDVLRFADVLFGKTKSTYWD